MELVEEIRGPCFFKNAPNYISRYWKPVEFQLSVDSIITKP